MNPRQFLSLLSVLAIPGLVAAQVPSNYYAAASDRVVKDGLNAVEAYHLQKGIDAMRRKQYYGAFSDFDFILRYFPNHPRGLLLMSELCNLWSDPRCDAEGYFNKAISMTPDNATVHIGKGNYLQRHQRFDDAIESYKQALLHNPNSTSAHYNLGLAYLAQKQYAAANEHAQHAYALGGASLPAGLRDKLVSAGAWRILDLEEAKDKQMRDAATGLESGRP